MVMENKMKAFDDPNFDITYFSVSDILTTSNEDWGGGDIEIIDL